MGMFDKIKGLASEHADKIDDAVDKVADVVDEKTGGKHGEHIDSAAEKAKGFLEDQLGDGGAGEGGEPPGRLSP